MVVAHAAVRVRKTQGAQIPPLKRFHAIRRRLGQIPGAVDPVIHDHQHAISLRLRFRRHPHGIEQVEVAVRAERRSRTHGPHQHHRLVRFENQVQEVGRLFERVGSVSDHHAVRAVALENPVQQLHHVEPVPIHQGVARQPPKRDFLHGRNVTELREGAYELSLIEPLAGLDVPGEIKAIGSEGVDGATRDDQCNFRNSHVIARSKEAPGTCLKTKAWTLEISLRRRSTDGRPNDPLGPGYYRQRGSLPTARADVQRILRE